jgi:hypothetical protein
VGIAIIGESIEFVALLPVFNPDLLVAHGADQDQASKAQRRRARETARLLRRNRKRQKRAGRLLWLQMLLQQHRRCSCSPRPRVLYRLGVEAGLSSVGGKPWADDACLAGLVRAIDDLLQPQAYLCSMGADRRLQAMRSCG